MTSKRSIDWFLESPRAWEVFSPERSLNQSKATYERLYPFDKPIILLYFRSFVFSVLFVRFHFKVIRKSLYLGEMGRNWYVREWESSPCKTWLVLWTVAGCKRSDSKAWAKNRPREKSRGHWNKKEVSQSAGLSLSLVPQLGPGGVRVVLLLLLSVYITKKG